MENKPTNQSAQELEIQEQALLEAKDRIAKRYGYKDFADILQNCETRMLKVDQLTVEYNSLQSKTNQSAQEVDVEKLAKEAVEKEFDGSIDNEITELEKIAYENGFFVGYNQALQSKAVGYSEEDMKEALRKGVNIGMQNVEKPRHNDDFNFNQEKCIAECKDFIQSLTSTPIQTKGREVEFAEWISKQEGKNQLTLIDNAWYFEDDEAGVHPLTEEYLFQLFLSTNPSNKGA